MTYTNLGYCIIAGQGVWDQKPVKKNREHRKEIRIGKA